ncbi:MAG: agmatine deiminase family protein [Acidimicrobiales bacterium]
MPRLTVDYGDFGTCGHIDIVAAFVRPGVVVAHAQRDRNHPDYAVCREPRTVASFDRRPRPSARGDRDPGPTRGRVDGSFNDWSYINHYVCNGAVILCSFDDPNDQQAAAILAEQYPGAVVLVDARSIFECGGGIHCITQQQPATR